MLVKTRLLPEVDSAFDMELRIRGTTLEVEGRIAYVQRIGGTDAEPEASLGVEFLEMDEERTQVLKEFIADELE